MSAAAIQTAGIILVVLPTVVWGGVTILRLSILRRDPYLRDNPLRRRLWIAGHAHAGVLLVLSLVVLVLLQYADLPGWWERVAGSSIPLAAVLFAVAFFLSVLRGDATRPNGLIDLAYVAAVLVAIGTLTAGIGLLRA